MDRRVFRIGNLRVVVVEGEGAAGELAAQFVATRLAGNPGLALALPTGKTPLPMYRALVGLYRAGQTDFAGARIFVLDDVTVISPAHPASYAAYFRRELLSRVNASARHTRLLDGLAADSGQECRMYESAIRSVGGLGLAILGIGRNGHIAFNEPGSPLRSRTRLVELTPETIKDNNFGVLLGSYSWQGVQTVIPGQQGPNQVPRTQRAQRYPTTPLSSLRSLWLNRTSERQPRDSSGSNARDGEALAQGTRSKTTEEDPRLCALTMGVGTILEAREVILLASGIRKAGVVARALQGPVTPDLPASALQLHTHVTAILDREAAKEMDLEG